MLNRIPIILILLTDRNVALIIQSQFVNRKQRIVHSQGAFNINFSTVSFNFDAWGFHSLSSDVIKKHNNDP